MSKLIGRAILDYQYGRQRGKLMTETSISDRDEMPLSYLFRNYDQMPAIERKALTLCHGKILDAGCGAGSHSLYLMGKGFDVTAIDISEDAVSACNLRNVPAQICDVMNITGTFDTILLMMNGTGICGKLQNLTHFLKKLKLHLATGGQILIDSSDISYMFDDDMTALAEIRSQGRYYGELVFSVYYDGQSETDIPWLYTDFKTLKESATNAGLHCEKVLDGEHHDYLARLI